jgi:DNA mismatch repair protein PMS2
MIKPLDSASIRLLCAGQVLSSLRSVVKELVENALDAKATRVEIALEQYGLGSISVSDNGTGMMILSDAECYLLARRATSKRPQAGKQNVALSQDASTMGAHDSLGFRGEALHSLAQLSDVTIETMHEDASEAVRVTYDPVSGKSDVSRGILASRRTERGTTVTVKRLFEKYPVRRQEYERTMKKQLMDGVGLLKEYSLSRPDVRIAVHHRPAPNDPPVTLLSTSGSGDVQRSVAEAYGGRMLANMTHVVWKLRRGVIQGYISTLGHGRTSGDIQVFALDGRLVELPRFAKVVTECFASNHPSAAQRTCPAYFLELVSQGDIVYDVNISPDKRRVLMELENELIEDIRLEATKTFRCSSEALEFKRDREETFSAKENARLQSLTFVPVSYTSPSQIAARPQKRSREDVPDDARRSLFEPSEKDESSCSLSNLSESLDANGEGDDVNEGSAPVVVWDEGGARPTSDRSSSFEVSFGNISSVEQDLHQRGLDWSDLYQREPEQGDEAPKKKKKRSLFTGKGLQGQKDEDLTVTLQKSSFTQMKIYGQFNHGFILASLEDDLFIIDQHAADEKYNFEQLMAKYVGRPQPLVRAVPVTMEAHEAELALAHRAELRSHGFVVSPAEQSDFTVVMVSSVPVLPYDTVVPQDVRDLTQQLVLYGSIVKPLRSVWHSMATKACRSSIMIGTVLSESTQRSIVDHLGTMDQPWNCPHGRPTLRHVGLLSNFSSK